MTQEKSTAGTYPSCYKLFTYPNRIEWAGLNLANYRHHAVFLTHNESQWIKGYTLTLHDGSSILEIVTSPGVMVLYKEDGSIKTKAIPELEREIKDWLSEVYRSTNAEPSTNAVPQGAN